MIPEPKIRIVRCDSASGRFHVITQAGLPEAWYKDDLFWINHDYHVKGYIKYCNVANEVQLVNLKTALNSADLRLILETMTKLDLKY